MAVYRHAAAIDAFVVKRPQEHASELIVAEPADHRDGRAEAARRDRLVEAFAAQMHGEVALYRLATFGPPRGRHHEIHVEAREDDDFDHATAYRYRRPPTSPGPIGKVWLSRGRIRRAGRRVTLRGRRRRIDEWRHVE